MQLGFLHKILRGYDCTAVKVGRRLQHWVSRYWDRLISPSIASAEGMSKRIQESIPLWGCRNRFIMDILSHIQNAHDFRSTGSNDYGMAFRETINVFLAIPVDFTIRVVFATELQSFSSHTFPFLCSSGRPSGLKSSVFLRILQMAFADGSYAVDFRTPDESGVIGRCYHANTVHVDNDVLCVAKEIKDHASHTSCEDEDLGIASIVYFPLDTEGVDPTNGKDNPGAIIGVYSVLPGAFSETECQALKECIQEALGLISPLALTASAMEGALKQLLRAVALQSTRSVAEVTALADAVADAISVVLNDRLDSEELSRVSTGVARQLPVSLLRFIEHHGKNLLPYVGRIEKGNPEMSLLDLSTFISKPSMMVQQFLTKSMATVTLPTTSVKVMTDEEALVAVYVSILRSFIERMQDEGREWPVEICIDEPTHRSGYGIITLSSDFELGGGRSLGSFNPAESAIVLRQGIPIPWGQGHGYGLYWARSILEGINARLRISRRRRTGLLTDPRFVEAAQVIPDLKCDKPSSALFRYRYGTEVKICLPKEIAE